MSADQSGALKTAVWFEARASTRRILRPKAPPTPFSSVARTLARAFASSIATPHSTSLGVKAVFAASDFSALGSIPCLAPTRNSDGALTPLKPYPVVASEEAQHVGDIVAMIVAESAFAARDGAETLEIDWEPLPAVVDSRTAIEPGAVQVSFGAPGNIAFDADIGDKAETDAVFARRSPQLKTSGRDRPSSATRSRS